MCEQSPNRNSDNHRSHPVKGVAERPIDNWQQIIKLVKLNWQNSQPKLLAR